MPAGRDWLIAGVVAVLTVGVVGLLVLAGWLHPVVAGARAVWRWLGVGLYIDRWPWKH